MSAEDGKSIKAKEFDLHISSVGLNGATPTEGTPVIKERTFKQRRTAFFRSVHALARIEETLSSASAGWRINNMNATRVVADLREVSAKPYGYLGVQAEEYIDWVGELMGRAINYSELNNFYDRSLSRVGECLKEIKERREKGRREMQRSVEKGVIVEYYQDVSPPVLQRQNGGSDR